MFGFVRRSTYDELEVFYDGVVESYGQSIEREADLVMRMRRLKSQLSGIMELCAAAGVDVGEDVDEYTKVTRLVDRIYVAASVVAENEKLNHFNRGMLAEREAAKSRSHAA